MQEEAGRITLEFTSPAKPALITWTGADGHHVSVRVASDAGPPGPGERSGSVTGAPGYAGTRDDQADDRPAVSEDSEAGSVPAFRYLLVPLRLPERA